MHAIVGFILKQVPCYGNGEDGEIVEFVWECGMIRLHFWRPVAARFRRGRVEVNEMQIEPFELERWQSVWENKVELNISESGVHPLTTAELVPDPEQLRKIMEVQQLYPQTNGSEELRSRIAELYPGASAENVLVTCGGSEANFVSTWSLIEPGDEVVFMMPNYMQIAGLARVVWRDGEATVAARSVGLGHQRGRLAAAGDAENKIIAICNPSNPTGAVLRDDMRAAVIAAAAKVGAWMIADEVYRGAEFDGEMTPRFGADTSVSLCTAGLSKAYSLPGLRTGWVVGAPKMIEKPVELSRLHQHRSFDADGPAGFGGAGAGAARMDFESHAGDFAAQLSAAACVAGRARGVVFTRAPKAGAIAWAGLRGGRNSAQMAEELRVKKGVLLVPWRTVRDGIVRAVWFRRRSGTFAKSARCESMSGWPKHERQARGDWTSRNRQLRRLHVLGLIAIHGNREPTRIPGAN